MIRRVIVRLVAWDLRRDLSMDEIDTIMRRAFPHRDWTWRAGIYEDAQARNARRKIRA